MHDAQRLESLIAATASGDAQAFKSLYDAMSAHLLGLLLRMLKTRELAEEALQDTFLKIWRKSETYAADKGSPSAWLYSIARHRALDLLRQQRPEDRLDADEEEDDRPALQLADASQNPEARAVEHEGIGRLERCMAGLMEQERQSLMLAYYEGYTHPELAQAMAAPLGTVKSWVRRGLAKLRSCLEATP